jgi:hypothetical protein
LSPAPIIVLTAQEASPGQASRSLDVLTNQVPQTVTRLQADSSIPADARVSVAVVARPSAPARSGKSQLRAMAVALVAGLVLTVLAASFVEALAQRRRAAVRGAGDLDEVAGVTGAGYFDGDDLAPVPERSLPAAPASSDPRYEPAAYQAAGFEAAAREPAYDRGAYEPDADEQAGYDPVAGDLVDEEPADEETAIDETAGEEAPDDTSEAAESADGREVLRTMAAAGGTIDELGGVGTRWEDVLSSARASLSRRLQELADEALAPPGTPHLKAVNGGNAGHRTNAIYRPTAAGMQDDTSDDEQLGETGTSPR